MKKSNKTLLQILVEELHKHGGWPDGMNCCTQSAVDSELYFYLGDYLPTDGANFRVYIHAHHQEAVKYPVITREQYEAALAAKRQPYEHPSEHKKRIAEIKKQKTDADGWIEWGGGEYPPVSTNTVVDVKLRCGSVTVRQPAGAMNWQSNAPDEPGDIIAYRLHHPQEAEQAKADDEADLNDCIGQTPVPVYSGYGVPPVGAAIEWREGRRWYPGTVTAIGEQLIIIKDQHGEEGSYSLEHTDFRRANFEVDELAAVIDASDEGGELIPSHQKAIAKHLIDAGYRKQ